MRIKQPLEHRYVFSGMHRRDFPHHVEVDIPIAVNQSIPHTATRTPWELGAIATDVFRHVLGCFTKYFNAMYDRILKLNIGIEISPCSPIDILLKQPQ